MTTARALVPTLSLLLAAPAAAQWTATEEARLAPATAQTGDDIGSSVSVFEDWCAVGAPADDAGGLNAGAVHVFRRDPGGWSLATTLYADAPGATDQFGHGVALVGDLLVVGAPYSDLDGADTGAAYAFRLTGGSWAQVARLSASGLAAGDHFGYGVGTDGDRVLVGAPHAELGALIDVGAAHVFASSGGLWVEEAELVPSGAEDDMEFGTAVDVDGAALIVGARSNVSCYVFEHAGGAWAESAQVSAPNEAHSSGIGRNCAIDGDTVVFGAPSDDLFGPGLVDAGSAYVWRRSPGGWNLEQKLKAATPADGDHFGRSVALDGDLIAIGANGVDSPAGPDTGAGFLFLRTGQSWQQQSRLVASDAQTGADFGRAVGLADGRVAFGAPRAAGTGAGYTFALVPPAPASYCTAGTSASGCSALLAAAGSASATAPSGFVVSASGVEGAKDGLLFSGTSGRQGAPWGSGTSFQCVVPPVKRGALLSGTGTSGLCDGQFGEDLNATWCPTCPKPHRNPGAGAVVQIQLWYRDPQNTSNQTTSLSDALEFGVGP